MRNIFTLISSVLLLVLSSSCKKEATSAEITKQMWDCNAAEHFDSTKLADKLIGSWQWQEYATETGNKKADKNIKVTFEKTGTYFVFENANLVTQGKWRLIIVDSKIFGLEMDGSSVYLYGRILLCNDRVEFNDSYRDGADNFFTRAN